MEICKVSEIDYAKGLIKVEFPAKDNIVSSWITFPANEYEMPEVGDLVKVEFEPDAYGNPYTSGICYQKCFNKDELPKMQGKDLFYKIFFSCCNSCNTFSTSSLASICVYWHSFYVSKMS